MSGGGGLFLFCFGVVCWVFLEGVLGAVGFLGFFLGVVLLFFVWYLFVGCCVCVWGGGGGGWGENLFPSMLEYRSFLFLNYF